MIGRSSMGRQMFGNRVGMKPQDMQKPERQPQEPIRMAKGGKVGRGDGCCTKGKTKGKYV